MFEKESGEYALKNMVRFRKLVKNFGDKMSAAHHSDKVVFESIALMLSICLYEIMVDANVYSLKNKNFKFEVLNKITDESVH